MVNTIVISLGGSIVAPEKVDIPFLREFCTVIKGCIENNASTRVILVVGGGGPARTWQEAYRAVSNNPLNEEADWIGIAATRLNARLIKAIFADYCEAEVVTDPTAEIRFTGKLLVAAGWKPGFSTDYDAVLLAERFNASSVVNLSNIEKVYTADPKQNPDAKPIDNIAWADFQKIVGTEWIPGRNVPFDPVATGYAKKLGLTVIVASGKEVENLSRILEGKSYRGTTIHP